jgi:hypothetical protein
LPEWRSQQCSGPFEVEWARHGSVDIDSSVLRELQRELWAAALKEAKNGTIGVASCCKDPERIEQGQRLLPCLFVSYDLCALAMSDVVGLVESSLRSRGITDARLGLSFMLSGAAGPRCTPEDPTCGPVPLGAGKSASPGDRCSNHRHPVDPPSSPAFRRFSRGSCAHDGECTIGGCGNRCTAWTEGNFISTCEGYRKIQEVPAYCGCVDGACTWFVAD